MFADEAVGSGRQCTWGARPGPGLGSIRTTRSKPCDWDTTPGEWGLRVALTPSEQLPPKRVWLQAHLLHPPLGSFSPGGSASGLLMALDTECLPWVTCPSVRWGTQAAWCCWMPQTSWAAVTSTEKDQRANLKPVLEATLRLQEGARQIRK